MPISLRLREALHRAFRHALTGITLAVAASAAVLSCSTTAHAACTSRDSWRGQDKQLHLVVGAAVAAGATAYTGSAWQGFAWGAGVGLVKEAIDARGGGTCSAQDLGATVAGAALGAWAAGWAIERQGSTTVVSYGRTF